MQQTAEEVDWAVAKLKAIIRFLIPHVFVHLLILKRAEPWRKRGTQLGIDFPQLRVKDIS